MPRDRHTIIYTHTDEAPALATRSLLPVINAFTNVAGVQVELRDISLAGRVLATFPDALTPEQRVNDDLAELGAARDPSRGQRHQAAERLGVDPAAQGHHRGAPGQGLHGARVPRRAEHRRGARRQGPLRQGEGLRGQPGAARGQLRPARAALGEELREVAPAQDGGVVARLQDPRGHHGARRLPVQRAVRHLRRRRRPEGRARGARRRGHGAQGVDPGARGRDRRRHVHERRGARRVPRRADGRRPGEGRAVLDPPQGHDDEGLRPDHLRPRGDRRTSPTCSRSTARRSSASA